MALYTIIDNQIHYFTIIKSKRKTLSIEIKPPGQVIVKAPVALSEEKIKVMVKEKEGWIQKKLKMMKQLELAKDEAKEQNGPGLMVQGKHTPITVYVDKTLTKPRFEHTEGGLSVYTHSSENDHVTLVVIQWYLEKCSETVSQRMTFYQHKMRVKASRVTLKDQKKRWGSCNSKGVIHINWRLIMAPEEVLDYVIVHELCHLVHMDHSKQFWQLVEVTMPGYKQWRKWLKEKGNLLMFTDFK